MLFLFSERFLTFNFYHCKTSILTKEACKHKECNYTTINLQLTNLFFLNFTKKKSTRVFTQEQQENTRVFTQEQNHTTINLQLAGLYFYFSESLLTKITKVTYRIFFLTLGVWGGSFTVQIMVITSLTLSFKG